MVANPEEDPIIEPSFQDKTFDIYVYLSEKKTKEESFFNRFFERIQSVFKKDNSQRRLSSDRISSIHVSTKKNLEKICELHEMLSETEHEVHRFFDESVLTFLKKEGENLVRSLNAPNIHTQVKVFSSVSNWNRKTLEWLENFNTLQADELVLEIAKFIEETTFDVINKDLQIIRDYSIQSLENTSFPEEGKRYLFEKIESEIGPLKRRLELLKELSRPELVKDFSSWKSEIDHKRQKYFDAALSVIDSLVEDISPSSRSSEEHEHLLTVVQEVNAIDHALGEIAQKIHSNDIVEDEKNELLEQLGALYEEAHGLSIDFRVPQNMFDRLQIILGDIEKIKDFLDREPEDG